MAPPWELAVQSMPALHAEAVSAEIVMSAGWAHEPARWVGLKPPLVLAPIPDSILGPQHPASSFAVENREIAHRDAERARLQISDAPLLDEELVANLCIGERVDCHAQSMQAWIT